MNIDNIKIRPAHINDAKALRDLSEQLGYQVSLPEILERLTLLLQDNTHLILVAESHLNGVLGWIHLLPHRLLISPVLIEIGGLVVHQQHRRKGIGRSLIINAEKWAIEQGCSGIIVRSNATRGESHLFYPDVGYQLHKTQRVYKKFF